MSQVLKIEDNKLIVTTLSVDEMQGNTTIAGAIEVTGASKFHGDLEVAKTLKADTLEVNNIKAVDGWSFDIGNWKSDDESGLNGKGFSWGHSGDNIRLIYRLGGRLWTNADFDLYSDKSYMIDGETVIGNNFIGPQIVKSSLREVGTLNNLRVSGDTNLGDVITVNTILNRVGINAVETHAALSVVENDVELMIGSNIVGTGSLGTHSNHNLAIITDNTPRILVKNSGEIVIGNELSKSASVTIFGTLIVDNLISDTKSETFSTVEFKGVQGNPIYDKGLIWSGTGGAKELLMKQGPDRLWTSESFDIAADQTYRVNNKVVLSENQLGPSITTSFLTEVGSLTHLEVQGTARFFGDIVAVDNPIVTKKITFNQSANILELTDKGVFASQKFNVDIGQETLAEVNSTEIILGNKENSNRFIKVFGTLSVGVNSPDPNFDLVTKGNAIIAGKKFVKGTASPTGAFYHKGDICWNDEPTPGSYIGWVCINSGNPGTWAPFGKID